MRNKKLELLQPFVGNWTTHGRTVDGKSIAGTDVYKWLDGGFFMIHDVNVCFADVKTSAVEIIHYDELDDVFRTQAFGSDGSISISTIKIVDDVILIFADSERFQGKFKLNKIEGAWEQRINGEWQHWMNIQLTRK